MQNPMAPANSRGASFTILHTATEPINHVDGTVPVRSEYPSPYSIPKASSNKRRNPKKPEADPPANPEGRDHAIDDYA